RRPRALAEREHVEPVRPPDQRVRLLPDPVDDAVARPDLVRLPVLPGETRAAEDVEDLLLVELDVDGRAALGGVDEEARRADVAGAGGVAEVDPDDRQRADLAAMALDLVPVGDHEGNLAVGAVVSP